MPGNPLTNPDWAPNLANTLERVVGGVRDKTTKPVLLIYRGLVYRGDRIFGGLTTLVLRSWCSYQWPCRPFSIGRLAHTTSVWVSYLRSVALFSWLVAVDDQTSSQEELRA